MDTPDAFKLLQGFLKAEDDNEDVTESDCKEYNNAIASVPSSLDPRTINASLTSRTKTELSNEESEHADSSISDDDCNDSDYAPSTSTSHLTENDSFTVTENGSPTVSTTQNAPVTRNPVSRPSRSQDADTNGHDPRPVQAKTLTPMVMIPDLVQAKTLTPMVLISDPAQAKTLTPMVLIPDPVRVKTLTPMVLLLP
ncbi:hypothetical protein PoB_006648500 [Plakobranchus ocellatus]|uniref:Uncharacterized protein n=1 Tax=Plakobranchus ocellatus TaxID=259542 RepID=A0AAV4D7F0_9GAST|nr:hypothetical protein PoB_006648500 [Plakobranchus ocellatus]